MTELHFSRTRSSLMALLAVGMVALLGWAAVNAGTFTDLHGIGRLIAGLGPEVLRVVFGAAALAAIWAGVIYVRQIGSGRPAARIEEAGVRLQTISGERWLDWRQIVHVELLAIGRQSMIRLHFRKPSGAPTYTGLVTGTLAETDGEIDLWIEEACRRLRG